MNRGSEATWDVAETGQGSGSASKRRRIGVACGVCRAKKSRCDGARPKCSACEELGYDCVYVQSASSANMIVGKEYLVGLEDRLKVVEEEITHLRNHRPTRQLRFEEDQNRTHSVTTSTDPNTITEGLEVNRHDLHDNMVADDVTDGMGAMVFTEEEDFGFFGPSSNIAFTRQISHAVTQISGSRQPRMVLSQLKGSVMSISRPSSPLQHGSSHQEGSQTDKVNIYALPPENRIRELLKFYFATTGVLFPYLHEKTFWDTYEEVRQNRFAKVRRTWLGLLNIVLALATSTSVGTDASATTRVQESDLYYQRAAGLCEKQMFRASSLEAVQFLIIMGQYLQGTQKSVQAWTIHGLTVKAAFQLGLHSTIASERFSPLEQEIRKRTWYGCVVLDRTLSMTFGRPASIPDSYVKLELPRVLDDDVVSTVSPGSVATDSVLFFNGTITLYKIMWNVITFLYDGNVGCDAPAPVLSTAAHLLNLEQQLLDWERCLPPSICLRKPQDIPYSDSDPSEKFRVILTFRHHNLRILLHRSMLVTFLHVIGDHDANYQELALLQQIGANSVHICVHSSMEIISIVSLIVKSGEVRRRLLGAWWFTLYYTFNAALVLCASLLVYHDPEIQVNSPTVPLEALRASINEAAQALQLLDIENPTINICAKYIRQLANVLDHLTSGRRPNSHRDIAAQTLANLNRQPPLPMNQPDATNMLTSGISPLGIGMELGEFILDGDLEFLNQVTVPLNANIAYAT